MRRHLHQMIFADGLANQRVKRDDWLTQLDKLIDCSAVAVILKLIYAVEQGRPSYPILTLVKLLLLRQWCSLSSPGLEEAVYAGINLRRALVLAA